MHNVLENLAISAFFISFFIKGMYSLTISNRNFFLLPGLTLPNIAMTKTKANKNQYQLQDMKLLMPIKIFVGRGRVCFIFSKRPVNFGKKKVSIIKTVAIPTIIINTGYAIAATIFCLVSCSFSLCSANLYNISYNDPLFSPDLIIFKYRLLKIRGYLSIAPESICPSFICFFRPSTTSLNILLSVCSQINDKACNIGTLVFVRLANWRVNVSMSCVFTFINSKGSFCFSEP